MKQAACTIPVDRRTFLVASGVGFAGLQFGKPQLNATEPGGDNRGGKAKTTILFFLCGGASHLDTFDLKPNAPLEYRGPFKPIDTTAPGVRVSEHLPLLAKQAHHLAVLNSVGGTVNTNDHHAGYYYNLTGHVPDTTFRTLGNNRTPYPDDWPFMGSVIASKRPTAQLPNAITLPHKPSRLPYIRPGQFAARIGIEHDPLYVLGDEKKPLEFRAPALKLQGDVTPSRLTSRRELLGALDAGRREFDEFAAVQTYDKQQERAVSLLMASQTTSAFNVEKENDKTLERYGKNINGMSLLLARRLAEAGVPFITIFWKGNEEAKAKCESGGGWDTHGDNFNCLKKGLLPQFDRAFSALIEDLHQRGMLDETLLMVTSEMGRKPKIGDPRSGGVKGQGRDHWTHCLSDVLVGGGIQGGQTYGTSDRFGGYPADLAITPADVTKTVYHAMGINDLTATDRYGRVYNLLDEGKPILELF